VLVWESIITFIQATGGDRAVFRRTAITKYPNIIMGWLNDATYDNGINIEENRENFMKVYRERYSPQKLRTGWSADKVDLYKCELVNMVPRNIYCYIGENTDSRMWHYYYVCLSLFIYEVKMAKFNDNMVIDYERLRILASEQKTHSYPAIFEAYYEHKLSPFFAKIEKYPHGLDSTTVNDTQQAVMAILKKYKQQYGWRLMLFLITENVLVDNWDYHKIPYEIELFFAGYEPEHRPERRSRSRRNYRRSERKSPSRCISQISERKSRSRCISQISERKSRSRSKHNYRNSRGTGNSGNFL